MTAFDRTREKSGRKWILGEPFLIWLALLGLLALTGALAYVPLGLANPAISLGIGALKAALIGIFYMHLRQSNGTLRLASLVGFLVLFALFLLVFADYLTRS